VRLIINSQIRNKLLEKHKVTEKEVRECFLNRERIALKDEREEHETDPPTLWMISRTNHLRYLKLVSIIKERNVILKTAYEPNQREIQIYLSKAHLLAE